MNPDFGAPVRPSLGGPPGGDPSAAPPPGGAPDTGGGSQDQAGAAIQQVMGAIRDLGQMAQKIGMTIPPLQPEAQQIQAIIRRMIIKAGQAAPTQTDSATALPTG